MTERKAIAKQEQQNIVELVRVLFPHLQGVSDLEIAKAIALARKLGLDPFRREVHFIPFKGSVQLVVSYLEYVKRAERSGKLDGWEVRLGKDELGEYAEVEIFRKDWKHSFKWRAYLNEVKKDTPNWKAMPLFMLRKTAIAQAFRLAFPEETQELPLEEGEIVEYETVEEVKTISEAQAKRLWVIAREVGEEAGIGKAEVEKVVREVLNEYGLESTKEIPTALYEEIIENIKARIFIKAKNQTEVKP
jgi:phage recombination protein Bet